MTEGDVVERVWALTAPDYQRALRAVGANLTSRQLDMLRAHHAAPGRALTARQLAAAVGYQSYRSTNLWYGRLAGAVCRELGLALTTHLFVICEFGPPTAASDGEWLWVMRPAVGEALEDLGWVPRTTGSGAGRRRRG